MAKVKPKTTAADLIAAASSKRGNRATPAPNDEAMAALKAVCEHNDAAARYSRVAIQDTIKMLREHGWTGASQNALDSLCRDLLGRRSYGTA